MKVLLNELEKYTPLKSEKIIERKEALSAAAKLSNNRQKVIEGIKNGIFPHIDGFQIEKESEEESEESVGESQKANNFKKFIEYIEKESVDINYDLFKEYFNFSLPTALAKKLYEIKNENKNHELVKAIKNNWSHLKDEIKKISEDEKRTEQPDQMLEIVEKVPDFNEQIRKQQGSELKILTRNQMLSRLPISLAQFKAGNNSDKLKKEIRQLLFSLYR